MIKEIKEQIYKALQDIHTYIWLLDKVNDQRKITLYLNIEYGIGLYHAYMKCLKMLDQSEYIHFHTLYRGIICNAQKEIEKIYQWRQWNNEGN